MAALSFFALPSQYFGQIFVSCISMSFKRIILTFAAMVLLCAGAVAQSTVPLRQRSLETGSGKVSGSSKVGTVGNVMDMKSLPTDFKSYEDDRLKEVEKAMEERDWRSEDTAWKRASAINTKDSYERYIGMYPYGAHRADADARLIDIQVNDAFKKDHGNLPGMKYVAPDEDSPTSTIVIENDTGYPLTVMYSGTESKSITIAPGFRQSITVKNGSYRIAASVPAPNIRPFAGTENLTGGRYETGYVVVPSRYAR